MSTSTIQHQKRRRQRAASASATGKEQRTSNVNQTKAVSHEPGSMMRSVSIHNADKRVKSSTVRPAPSVTPRKPTTKSRDPPQPTLPLVAPRTIPSIKKKVEQPPVPAPRKSLKKEHENSSVSEQLTTPTQVPQPSKRLSIETTATKRELPDQQLPATELISESTPYTPGLCGLINIGNTCFMNSALQCLSNLPALTRWSRSHQTPSSAPTKDVADIYASLIQSMWSGTNSVITPRHIKDVVSQSAPMFADYGQKDSHEFMNSLLNALEQTSFAPIIAQLFHIRTQSQVTCSGCHSVDTTDEKTTFLPLPLPERTSSTKEISLEDLIRDYCAQDYLDGLYYCHACSNYTRAKQQTRICSPVPPVLIIQLKRFPFDGTTRKVDTFVRYKLHYESLLASNDSYQLCAVSSHRGSLAGGHYTTLARNDRLNQWYLFNDDHLQLIDRNEAITGHAYVLVYSKVEKCDDTPL